MNMNQPLAMKLRPTSINDIAGQQHLIGEGKIIRRMLNANRITSMILYGPPGIGKTSIASAISGSANLPFYKINASTDGKKELQLIAKETENQQAVVLIDEIHRLDKTKQDFLLSRMESGNWIMIGATTENPFLSINPAIRSRAQIFELKPLTSNDLEPIVTKAIDFLEDQTKRHITLQADAKSLLLTSSNGDVRNMLNNLEIAVYSTQQKDDTITITIEIMEEITQRSLIPGDKNGDAHYDTISALQKSIRGSDVDASLFYTAKIIASGDLQILVRRLSIIAYEDIGTASPNVAQQAITAINTAMHIGLPEAKYAIANAVILMANAPKSNAATIAINTALEDVYSNQYNDIPNALRDAHYKGAGKLGHGTNYKYAHNYPFDWVAQQYLPDSLWQINRQYLKGKNSSQEEKDMQTRYDNIKTLQRKRLTERD